MNTFGTWLSSKAARIAICSAAIAATPIIASAKDRGHDFDHRDDYRHVDEHHDWDHHDRDDHDSGRIDVRIGDSVRPQVEDRVWVEPVYRDEVQHVWVPATYRTVVDHVWVPAVTRTEYQRAWVEDGHKRGHWETRPCEVVVTPGHYEDAPRQELVCDGHYDDVTQQVLVSPGHWEDRVVVAPPHEESHLSIGLRIPF